MCIHGFVNPWIHDEYINSWIHEGMNSLIKWVNTWINGFMNVWIHQLVRWIHEFINSWMQWCIPRGDDWRSHGFMEASIIPWSCDWWVHEFMNPSIITLVWWLLIAWIHELVKHNPVIIDCVFVNSLTRHSSDAINGFVLHGIMIGVFIIGALGIRVWWIHPNTIHHLPSMTSSGWIHESHRIGGAGWGGQQQQTNL